MKLIKLKVRGFRGFNKEQEIPLDNNIIIIYGLNGSGKSSFTEAIEWLFFGEITRQRLSRCRSEYQHEEYLRNLFYTSGDNPLVEIEGKINKKSIKIRKEITPEGEKCFINDKIVSDFKSLELNLESYFRPMLAQTEIKALVDSEQKDRWEQLSSILGQDELTKLRENLIALKSNKRDEEHKKQELKCESLLSDIDELKSIETLKIPVKHLDIKNLLEELKIIIKSSATTLKEVLEEIRIKEKDLLSTELGKSIADISYGDFSDLNKYLKELRKHFEELEELATLLASEGKKHNYMDFLKKGLEFVKLPECPFCLEKTLTQKRVESIKDTLEKGKAAQEAKVKFDKTRESIETWLKTYSDRIEAYLPAQKGLKIVSQKFIDLNRSEFALKIQNIEENISNFISESFQDLKNIVSEFLVYVEKKYFHEVSEEKNYLESLEKIIEKLVSNQKEINSKWEELKIEIAKKITLTTEIDQEEIKKWMTLEKITSFFLRSPKFIKKKKLLETIDSLQKKVEQFEKKEVERLLKEHGDEIKSYYQKLNSGDKIQFSKIEVKGGARRQAKLKALAFDKDINPITCLSEAHTNSLALSIYFPQRVDRNKNWEVVILDDPVQSMDENHSQALIEILFEIAKKKQLIILTHSKSFYRRLSARFTHLIPKIYLFYNNDNEGPSIELDEGELDTYISLVKSNCKDGKPRLLETASFYLRKAIESVCFKFLLEKGVNFGKSKKAQKSGLDSLFVECEKHGLPVEEIGKLKSVLDTSHGDSHAWSVAETTPGCILEGLKHVEQIKDVYLR